MHFVSLGRGRDSSARPHVDRIADRIADRVPRADSASRIARWSRVSTADAACYVLTGGKSKLKSSRTLTLSMLAVATVGHLCTLAVYYQRLYSDIFVNRVM